MMLDAAGRSDLPATRESWLLLTDDEIVQTSEVYVNEVDEEEAAFVKECLLSSFPDGYSDELDESVISLDDARRTLSNIFSNIGY